MNEKNYWGLFAAFTIGTFIGLYVWTENRNERLYKECLQANSEAIREAYKSGVSVAGMLHYCRR